MTSSPEASEPARDVMVALMGPFSGHAETRAWQHLEEFYNPDAAFDRVFIVSMADDYDYGGTQQIGSLTILPVTVPRPLRGFRLLAVVWLMIAACHEAIEVIRTQPVKLVGQIYGGPLKMGLPALVAGILAGLPTFVTLHSDYGRSMGWTYSKGERWVAEEVWRFIFRRATTVRSVSEYITEFARTRGVDARRLVVIPNKERTETFASVPPAEDLERVAAGLGLPADVSVVCLSVGRMIPAKNTDTMLRAFAASAVRRPDLRYVLAGDGPLRADLQALCAQLGIEDRVVFTGFVPHQTLSSLYHLADMLLFVSHYEGQPRVAVEAMLAGLPIVCSDFGQVCDLVADGEDGIRVSPNDPHAISSAIDRIADDPVLRKRLGEHDNFDPKAFTVEAIAPLEAGFYRRTMALGLSPLA